jgi:hypothetical protein
VPLLVADDVELCIGRFGWPDEDIPTQLFCFSKRVKEQVVQAGWCKSTTTPYAIVTGPYEMHCTDTQVRVGMNNIVILSYIPIQKTVDRKAYDK